MNSGCEEGSLIIFILCQRYIVQSIATSGLKG